MADLSIGRQALGMTQQRYRSGCPSTSTDARADALRAVDEREQRMRRTSSGLWFDGVVGYEPTWERQRLLRTREIIDRVSPGPLENGTALEAIAREAAAIELVLESTIARYAPSLSAQMTRILLGTTGRPSSHASTIAPGGVPVIAVSSGMLSLLDALAASCMAVLAAPHAHRDGYYVTSTDAAVLRDHLDQHPEVVGALVGFFKTWLHGGTAPAATYAAVHERHRPFARLLGTHALRFVIAHEYCHALVDKLGAAPWGGDGLHPEDPYSAEIRADLFAVRLVAVTSKHLDLVPPNVGLQGAVLAMKAHEVLDEALSAVGTKALAPSLSHPPFRVRSLMCVESFRWFLQGYDDDRQEAAGVLVPALLIELAWGRALPRVKELAESLSLHPMWRGAL